MDEAARRHTPVLLERCVALLAPALADDGAVVVDATLGLGGHSEALLERCPAARLVGIDRDPQAIELAGRRLAPFADRVTLVHAVYDRIGEVLADLGLRRVQGVLLDLGVSSLQLDEADRGFSYARDAPLDMRMDPTAGLTAADVLNTYDARALTRVLRVYGEERFARRIAARVVRDRAAEPFTTSARLVDLVRECVPAPARRTGGNPAKRTFQALRIEVNGERIAVLAYHSLEDRLAKAVLSGGARSTAPEGLPVELPEHAPRLRLLTRGAEKASDPEIAANPRAASVRLRAAERVRPPVPRPQG